MSVQSKNDFEVSSSHSTVPSTVQASQSTSKIVELNGKTREVERISIDDPAALNGEILKLESIQKSENYKSTAWLVAASVLGLLGLGIGVAFFIISSPLINSSLGVFWCASVMLLPMYSAYIPLWMVSRTHEKKSHEAFEQVERLKKIQTAMRSEDFRAFARKAGDSFTVDELSRICTLFREAKSCIESELTSKETLARNELKAREDLARAELALKDTLPRVERKTEETLARVGADLLAMRRKEGQPIRNQIQ